MNSGYSVVKVKEKILISWENGDHQLQFVTSF